MKSHHFWTDKKQLLRQLISAWLILFVAVILFVIVSLVLSSFINNHAKVVILSFSIVAPLLISAHILLSLNNYHLQSITSTFRKKPTFSIENLHNLIVKISEGDSNAFDYFYEQTRQPLINYITKKYAPQLTKEDIEDIVQSTALKVLRDASSYKGDTSNVSALKWIYSKVHTEADKVIKINNRLNRRVDSSISDMDETTSNLYQDNISESEKDIVLLYSSNELTYEQIADRLNVPILYVKQIIIKTLREKHQ